MDKLSRLLTWPVVALLLGGGAIFGAIVIFAPEDTRTLLIGANGLVWTIVAALLRDRDSGPPTPPPAALLALGCVLGAGVLSGCGASPLRQHAIASQMTIATLSGAGVAIEQATALALDRCERITDRSERDGCIDGVEHAATRAAATRDMLIAPAHAHRDVVLASGGDETPGLIGYLGVVARPIAEDWPAFADAMRALGVPVPAFEIPTTEEAR